MKKSVLSLLLATALFWIFSAPAAAAGVRIGIIDTTLVLQKSTPAADARGAFLMEVESKKSVLKEKEREIRVLDQVLKSVDNKKSAEEKTRIRQQMQKEIKALRRLKADMEEELKKEEARLTRKLLAEIRVVVQDYAKRKKLTAVLEKKLVVAFDDSVDITRDIIRLYNSKKK